MNRIEERFARLRERGEKGLVVYIGAGDPSLEATRQLALAFGLVADPTRVVDGTGRPGRDAGDVEPEHGLLAARDVLERIPYPHFTQGKRR